MKVTIFILGLLSFNYIMSFYQDYGEIGKYAITEEEDCTATGVAYPDGNNTFTKYCRSRHIDEESYYRCCYLESSNGTRGCVPVTYADFSDSSLIKNYIDDNTDIHCNAGYLGISLLALLAVLF